MLKTGFSIPSVTEHPSYYSLSPSAAVPHGNREIPQFHGAPQSHPSHRSADGQDIRGAIRTGRDYTPHPARPHPTRQGWTSTLISTTTAFRARLLTPENTRRETSKPGGTLDADLRQRHHCQNSNNVNES